MFFRSREDNEDLIAVQFVLLCESQPVLSVFIVVEVLLRSSDSFSITPLNRRDQFLRERVPTDNKYSFAFRAFNWTQ